MLKIKISLAVSLIIAFALISCAKSGGTTEEKIYDEIQKSVHIDASGGTLVSSSDTHGGFHGDGMSYAEISFSNGGISENLPVDGTWKPLPLSENLAVLVYGNGQAGPYLKNESGEAVFPSVKNGFYCFIDRQSEKTDPYSDDDVLERASINITIAVYDADTDTLYYSKFDT